MQICVLHLWIRPAAEEGQATEADLTARCRIDPFHYIITLWHMNCTRGGCAYAMGAWKVALES
jgi:hypothetical protein